MKRAEKVVILEETEVILKAAKQQLEDLVVKTEMDKDIKFRQGYFLTIQSQVARALSEATTERAFLLTLGEEKE